MPEVGTDLDVSAPAPSRRLEFGTMLAIIALVGLIARVVYVIVMRDQAIYGDSLGYHFRAQLLADGKGYVLPAPQVLGIDATPPDASIPPGWQTVLAVPTMLGLRSVLSHQLFACFVGAATIVMTGLAGRVAFGRRAGLIAAGIVAVYPNIWIYERELMVEPLAMLLVATCIWLAYLFLAKPGPWLALALGAAIGALALTRSEQLALLALLALPLIVSRRGFSWPRRVTWLVLAGVGCALFLAPWAAYNTTRFERPVLLSNGLGGAMRAGNCDPTFSGERLGYYQVTFVVGRKNGCTIVDKKFANDQSVIEGQLRSAALEYMGDHLSRVPVVVAARIGRTFNAFRPFQQVHFEAERKSSIWVPRLGLFTYWILLPLAVVGAVAARRRAIKIYPLLAFPALVVIAVALTIGAVRYRAPAEVPLALLAAFGVHVLLEHWQRRASVGAVPDSVPPRRPVAS